MYIHRYLSYYTYWYLHIEILYIYLYPYICTGTKSLNVLWTLFGMAIHLPPSPLALSTSGRTPLSARWCLTEKPDVLCHRRRELKHGKTGECSRFWTILVEPQRKRRVFFENKDIFEQLGFFQVSGFLRYAVEEGWVMENSKDLEQKGGQKQGIAGKVHFIWEVRQNCL